MFAIRFFADNAADHTINYLSATLTLMYVRACWVHGLHESAVGPEVKSGPVPVAEQLVLSSAPPTLACGRARAPRPPGRAPATGSIQGLTGLSPGAWLSAGQMIGAVSPSDALLIETFVSPKDVGLLRLGQPARLQIDAYPYTQWGLLDATVMTLAADSSGTNGANSTSGFKVTLQPIATTLYLPNGTAGPLRKGLTLSARFVVARRSLLQILYEDVSAWLNPQEPQSKTL
jgi:hypothetical protein